jgi:hypothetical protein
MVAELSPTRWVDQHVGGLHVAMNKAARVGGVERPSYLANDVRDPSR